MSAFEVLLVLAFLGVAGFQAWLTVRVFKSNLYEKKQKIWQAQLIWLVPVVGAGLVFSILREDAAANRPASTVVQRKSKVGSKAPAGTTASRSDDRIEKIG